METKACAAGCVETPNVPRLSEAFDKLISGHVVIADCPPDGWHSAKDVSEAYGIAICTAKKKMDMLERDGKVIGKLFKCGAHPTKYYKVVE